jgi:hypothetical protein
LTCMISPCCFSSSPASSFVLFSHTHGVQMRKQQRCQLQLGTL